MNSKKILVSFVAAALTASAGAFAHDRYDDSYGRNQDGSYDAGEGAYDYAKVIDVQPLVSRVRVNTPQQECWDETRQERPRGSDRVTGGTLLGAVIGAAVGNQIGSGDGRRAATAGGAIIGAAIGHQTATRNGDYGPPPREYTVQRCETRYHDEWQERVDGYRVTYQYHGRRGVTEMPYKPGDRIRVRVNVEPA